MIYTIIYTIPSDTIPWYVWYGGGVDAISLKRYGFGILLISYHGMG